MKTIRVLFLFMMIGAFAISAACAQEAPEAEKVKVEVSNKIVERHAPAVNMKLKEIVRDAETHLKKIDGTLVGRDNEKAAKERYENARQLGMSGKYEEARDEYEAARKLTENASFKKTIKESESRIADKAKNQERARVAADKAKADAERRAAQAKKPAVTRTSRPAPQKRYAPAARQMRSASRPMRQAGPATNFTPANARTPQPTRPAMAQAPRAMMAATTTAVTDDSAARAKADAQRKAREEAAARARAEAEAKAKAAEAAAARAKAQAASMAQAPAAQMPKMEPAKIEAPVVTAQPVETGEDVLSKTYREAVSLYWDNKYEEAKAKFEQVGQKSEDYARTNYYLGRIKEKLGK